MKIKDFIHSRHLPQPVLSYFVAPKKLHDMLKDYANAEYNTWIEVSDRLPELHEKVLVMRENGTQEVLFLSKSNEEEPDILYWFDKIHNHILLKSGTHWKLLPKQPI